MSILNKIKSFFNQTKPYPYSGILHLWEDDYAMIELIPAENLVAARDEGKRIYEFGEKHRDGLGFSDITVINEMPIKTIEKKVSFSNVLGIFQSTGLKPITEVVHQYVGLKKSDNPPFGFGTEKFGILLEEHEGNVNRIWFTGRTEDEVVKNNLKTGLSEFCSTYEFIGVDWYNGNVFDLRDEKQLYDFIEEIC